MTRVYENKGFARRMNISAAVVVAVALYGVWELWAASTAETSDTSYGYFFAVLFIGGGIYGMRQLLTEFTNTVTSLDIDEGTGRATIAVWRPFVPKRIESDVALLTDWRFYTSTARRNIKLPMLLADHPQHSKPLQFELGQGISISERLRALAPEAVAAYEMSRSGG